MQQVITLTMASRYTNLRRASDSIRRATNHFTVSIFHSSKYKRRVLKYILQL